MATSFSANAKAEVCRSFPQKQCCALAQGFGVLLFANSFTDKSIRIITESKEFSQMLPRLFKKTFGVTFDTTPDDDAVGKLIYQITDPEKIRMQPSRCGFFPDL